MSGDVSGAGGVPGSLSPSTVVAVRRAIGARDPGRPQHAWLETAAGLAADDARRRGLPPEAMLVALKCTWATLDEARRLPADVGRPLLDRLVSLGIESYYAYRPLAAGGTDGPSRGHRAA